MVTDAFVRADALDSRVLFRFASDFTDLKITAIMDVEVGIGAISALNTFSVIATFAS